MSPLNSLISSGLLLLLGTQTHAATQRTIMAGGETSLPADSPAIRLDPLGSASPFNFVGALQISVDGFNYRASASAISPHWVLTAGHNLDSNDDGAPDAGLAMSFHLPGLGSFSATTFFTCPGFTGFGNPSTQRDLGLVYFAEALPETLSFPGFHADLRVGADFAMAGFGRSGYGDYGYTTEANLTDRRIGWNVVDSLEADSLGAGPAALLRYDFDPPGTVGQPGGSLGNASESIIGPGDSGGPILVRHGEGYAVVGVSTFTEGYGGRFGDIGGAVVLAPYMDWIGQTTGLVVPEPSIGLLLSLGFALVLAARQITAHISFPAPATEQRNKLGFGPFSRNAPHAPSPKPMKRDPSPMNKPGEGSAIHRIRFLPASRTPDNFWDPKWCYYSVALGDHVRFPQDSGPFTWHIAFLHAPGSGNHSDGACANDVISIMKKFCRMTEDGFFLVVPGDVMARGQHWSYINVFKRYHSRLPNGAACVQQIAEDLFKLIRSTYPELAALCA